MRKPALGAALAAVLLVSATSRADGIVIDKIYHPYVQPLEQEFELRASLQNHQPGVPDDLGVWRFAYARSLGEKWSGEVYLVGRRSDDSSFDVEAYEVEALRQLTEQGEYWADWGVVFELEKERHQDAWEFAVGALAEKEWGKWSGTANLFLIQEWGSDVRDELETRLGLQARYRHSPAFEPAIEIYSGEDTRGIGPVALGLIRLGGKRQLRWEAGAIFGVDSKSPDTTLRFLLEYEF